MKLDIAKKIITDEANRMLKEGVVDLWCYNNVTSTFDIKNGYHWIEVFSEYKSDSEIVTLIEEHGGMGMGDLYYIVVEIDDVEHGKGFVRIDGLYDSWEGVDWAEGEICMVESRPRTITEWHKIL